MAPVKQQLKCRCCFKNVTKTSKALFCQGKCKLWFHNTCVGITNDEYQLFLDLNTKAVFMCEECRLDNGAISAASQVSKETDNKLEVCMDCAGCLDHIKILTDQIYELTSNQKQMSSLIDNLKSANQQLSSALHNQGEALSDLMLSRDNKVSFASKVKFDKDKLFISNYVPKSTDLVTSPRPVVTRPMPNLGQSTSASTPMLADVGLHANTEKMNSSNHALSGQSLQQPEMTNCNLGLEEEDFSVVKSRKERRVERKREHPKMELQPKPTQKRRKLTFITGKSTTGNHNLTISDRKIFLFVSRLSPETECDDLQSFLKMQKDSDYLVEKLTAKFPKLYSSFKIGIPASMYQDVFSADFWPNNVFVSKFFSKRANNKTSSSESLNLDTALTKTKT